jgi:acyl-CoA reductase-like NAD-dependent aldehyde dehydrogenase
MTEYTMTIDGKAVRGDATIDVKNPATGAPFAKAPDCSRAQLDAAMESAEAAYKRWCRDEPTRRQALLACADAIQAAVPEAGRILTKEQGKPLQKAIGELYGAAVWFRATAGLEIPVEVVQDDEKARIEVRRRPFGVVGAITPWNFPVLLAVWKIAPALLAGNTVVIKPSPYTPLSTLRLGEILRDVLPPGVLNVVSGGDALGAWITEHPAVRKVSFAGSVATGKRVAAAAAPDLKRVTPLFLLWLLAIQLLSVPSNCSSTTSFC